jgi:hypothetical protein
MDILGSHRVDRGIYLPGFPNIAEDMPRQLQLNNLLLILSSIHQYTTSAVSDAQERRLHNVFMVEELGELVSLFQRYTGLA